MGATSQRKGRTAERELARILQSYGYPVETAAPLNYGTIPDLIGLDGIHIECKRCEKFRINEWMSQAEGDAQRFGDGAPTVFFRRSRSPWLVCMKLEDWIDIYLASERQKTEKSGN